MDRISKGPSVYCADLGWRSLGSSHGQGVVYCVLRKDTLYSPGLSPPRSMSDQLGNMMKRKEEGLKLCHLPFFSSTFLIICFLCIFYLFFPSLLVPVLFLFLLSHSILVFHLIF